MRINAALLSRGCWGSKRRTPRTGHRRVPGKPAPPSNNLRSSGGRGGEHPTLGWATAAAPKGPKLGAGAGPGGAPPRPPGESGRGGQVWGRCEPGPRDPGPEQDAGASACAFLGCVRVLRMWANGSRRFAPAPRQAARRVPAPANRMATPPVPLALPPASAPPHRGPHPRRAEGSATREGCAQAPGGTCPPGRLPQLRARSPSVLRAKARPTWLAGSSLSLLAEGPSAFSSLAFFCSAFPAEAVAAGGLPLAGLQPPPCGARAQGGCRSAEGSTTAGRGATAASEQGPLDAHTAAGPLPTGAKAPLGPASKVGAGLLVAKSQDRQEAADLRVYFPTFSTGQLR